MTSLFDMLGMQAGGMSAPPPITPWNYVAAGLQDLSSAMSGQVGQSTMNLRRVHLQELYNAQTRDRLERQEKRKEAEERRKREQQEQLQRIFQNVYTSPMAAPPQPVPPPAPLPDGGAATYEGGIVPLEAVPEDQLANYNVYETPDGPMAQPRVQAQPRASAPAQPAGPDPQALRQIGQAFLVAGQPQLGFDMMEQADRVEQRNRQRVEEQHRAATRPLDLRLKELQVAQARKRLNEPSQTYAFNEQIVRAPGQDPVTVMVDPRERDVTKRYVRADTGEPYQVPEGAVMEDTPKATQATQFQQRAAGFFDRMASSEEPLQGYEQTVVQDPSFGAQAQRLADYLASDISEGGGLKAILNYAVSPAYQEYASDASSWISGLLRYDSGAAVPESEFRRYYRTYFYIPGDNPGTLAVKARNRASALNSLRRGAGPAVDSETQRTRAENLRIQHERMSGRTAADVFGRAPDTPGTPDRGAQSIADRFK